MLSRLLVASLLIALVLLTAAQHAGTVGPTWLELTRYLPYPVYLLPVALALLVSLWLGWPWVVASLAVGAGVLAVTMGLAWARDADPGPANLRFMTYNIKAAGAAKRTGGFVELAREIEQQHPDLLVMQDARSLLPARDGAAGPDGSVFGLPQVRSYDQYVIASRYPLLDCAPGFVNDLVYFGCTVDVKGVPVRVVTVHFESPRTGLDAARRAGFDGVRAFRRNYEERLAQSRSLAEALVHARRPLIVAGDLNAPESSAVVRTLLRLGLRDAFTAAGRGYGYSYGQSEWRGISFLRIDHVLVSESIGVVDCEAGAAGPSEHQPVVADLVIRPGA